MNEYFKVEMPVSIDSDSSLVPYEGVALELSIAQVSVVSEGEIPPIGLCAVASFTTRRGHAAVKVDSVVTRHVNQSQFILTFQSYTQGVARLLEVAASRND